MHAISPAHPGLPALFDTPYLNFVVTAMGAGNSPALAWVDDTHSPTSAFIWDKSHSLYFGGDAHNQSFTDILRDYLVNSLIPEAKRRELGILKLYLANDDWRTETAAWLPNTSLQERARGLYRLDHSATVTQLPNLPPQMELRLIDEALLQNRKLTGMSAVIEEIESCWTSLEHFVDQAFGYCVSDDTDGVISWCTAEYFSPGVCGIGIKTLEPYQQRGLATLTASAFTQHATRLGWQVNWDCWLNNTPSIRVAEKVGFEKINDYRVGIVVLE